MAQGTIKVDTIQVNAQSSITLASPIKVDSIARNANTAGINIADPPVLASNSLIGSPLGGAIEYDGTYFYVTLGSTRYYLMTSANATLSGTVYPRRITPGELALSFSNTTTYGIAAGSVLDSTFAYPLSLGSAWTKTTAAWVAGTGNGSLDTGSLASTTPGTPYSVWLIRKDSDGSTDVLMSANMTAPTMPAGYTYKRRIGYLVLTAAGTNLQGFTQFGNRIYLAAQANDYAYAAFASTNRILQNVTAPVGTIGIFEAEISWNTTATNHFAIFQSTTATDSAASATNNTHFVNLNAATTCMEIQIPVDTNKQIAVRGDATTNFNWRLGTTGWIDLGI